MTPRNISGRLESEESYIVIPDDVVPRKLSGWVVRLMVRRFGINLIGPLAILGSTCLHGNFPMILPPGSDIPSNGVTRLTNPTSHRSAKIVTLS